MDRSVKSSVFGLMQYCVPQPRKCVVQFSVTQADVLRQDSWGELHYSCCWLELVLHIGVDQRESRGSAVTCTVIPADELVVYATLTNHYVVAILMLLANPFCSFASRYSCRAELRDALHRHLWLLLSNYSAQDHLSSFLALRAASIFQAAHHKEFLVLWDLILFIFISICCLKKCSLQHVWEKCGRI